MRRMLALLLMMSTLGLRAESVVGEVLDADVHHETAAQAWVHAHDPHGPHAHDPAGVASGHTDDSGDSESAHDHARCDHCSHAHGVALIGHVSFAFFLTEIPYGSVGPLVLSDFATGTLSPPPRS